MVKVLSFIPLSLSVNEKTKYINGIKEALSKSFELSYKDIRVYITNYKPEDSCINFSSKMATYIYIPLGKTDGQKEQFSNLYKKVNKDVFGNQAISGLAIIHEHSLDQEYINGTLLSRAK